MYPKLAWNIAKDNLGLLSFLSPPSVLRLDFCQHWKFYVMFRIVCGEYVGKNSTNWDISQARE